MEGQLWANNYTEFSNHDDVISATETGATEDETVFADREHPM